MLINWSRIESFISEDSPEEIEWLKGMIKTLIDNLNARLDELDQITQQKDDQKLKALLHQIKGVAANFGLDEFQNTTIKAESEVKNGDVQTSIKTSLLLRGIWENTKRDILAKYPIS